MNIESWLRRADRALTSASQLVGDDPDRACSSAYYAMFYAARAALIHVGQAERAMGKTHMGMIAAFNQYLARPGILDIRYGRMLQDEFSRRLIADYDAEGLDEDAARDAIASATAFLGAVHKMIDG